MSQTQTVGSIHGDIQLADGGQLTYTPGFFPAPVADEMFAVLRDGLTWEQMKIYGHREPRMTKWFGEFAYTYSGITRPAISWDKVPQALQSIRSAVEHKVFGTSAGQFNGVLLNYYRTGDDKIGWHADNEEGILRDSPIASLSFGAERRFILKHNDTGAHYDITLAHGSLLVMAGTTQRFWKHCVPIQRRIREGRINLTFRMYSRWSASGYAFNSLGQELPHPLTTEGNMAEVQEVDIDLIKIDREIQPREGLDDERIKLFHELYLDKDTESEPPPPLTVFHDAEDAFWLSDGFHRYEAARAARSEGGPSKLPVEIHVGNRRDAFLYAVGVNGKHGKELTRQEKRNAVCRILRDPEWSQWSVRKIARHTGTSIGLVSTVRSELESQNATVHDEQCASSRTVEYERSGKKQTMKRGDGGRARKNKAKKDTTTTPPAAPEIPQEEPITDGAEMSTAGDRQEAETTSGFDDQATQNERERSTPEDFKRPTDDDQEQNQENNTSTAISNLKVAWSQANSAERFSFLQWLITHEKDEIQNRAVDAISALLEHANEDMW